MGFEQLIEKVHQAEDVLESRERVVVAHARQVKASWRSAWTPGRIVVAGLVSGFFVGLSRPLRGASNGGQWLQMVTALSGLLASGSAQVAAASADEAASEASHAAQAVAPEGPAATSPSPARAPAVADPGSTATTAVGADPRHPDA